MKMKTVIIKELGLEVFQAPVTQKQYKKIMEVNPSYHNKERMGFSTKKFPVTNVSAHDAEKFCSKLGNGWRLPTTKEWTSMAGKFKYSGSDDIDEVAVYGQQAPTEVKTKKPNEYGLYDMSGLVWEWTSTMRDSYRVARGGSWNYNKGYCRVSNRHGNTPAYWDSSVGFRPVRTIKEEVK